jgi:integrase
MYTVADIIDRYLAEVVPKKREKRSETILLMALKRQAFSALTLDRLTSRPFADYRDTRLKKVKPATVCREFSILRHAFETARKEWGFPLRGNPLDDVKRPVIRNQRERRPTRDELEQLFSVLYDARKKEILRIVQFALETGMRRSEILNMSWDDLNTTERTLKIPITKNGDPRTIPLSTRALELLAEQRHDHQHGQSIFSMTPCAVQLQWNRRTKKAGIFDLRFHDLRHEAISRFFERGLSVPEVALISGHKDYRMLFRYTHLKAQDIVARLDS